MCECECMCDDGLSVSVSVWICMYVCLFLCECFLCTNTYIYVYTHTSHACMYACMTAVFGRVPKSQDEKGYIYIYIYTYIHTHTYACTYVCMHITPCMICMFCRMSATRCKKHKRTYITHTCAYKRVHTLTRTNTVFAVCSMSGTRWRRNCREREGRYQN
jgi:hypothetical protein